MCVAGKASFVAEGVIGPPARRGYFLREATGAWDWDELTLRAKPVSICEDGRYLRAGRGLRCGLGWLC